jgi:hypothetical protein
MGPDTASGRKGSPMRRSYRDRELEPCGLRPTMLASHHVRIGAVERCVQRGRRRSATPHVVRNLRLLADRRVRHSTHGVDIPA